MGLKSRENFLIYMKNMLLWHNVVGNKYEKKSFERMVAKQRLNVILFHEVIIYNCTFHEWHQQNAQCQTSNKLIAAGTII